MKRTAVWIDERAVRVGKEEFPFDDRDALPGAFARALEATPLGGPIELRLGDAWLQFRRLPGLPPVSARDLRSLVAEEPNRYFRRRPGGLVVDVRWDGEADPPEARAAAVERAVLDVLEARAEAAGRVVLRISPAAADGSDLTFDTPAMRAARKRWAVRKARRWVAVAASVWLAAAALFTADLRLDLRRGGELADSLEARAAELDRVVARLEGARRVARAIRLPTEEGGWATAALVELSRAIPDSARVESLELSARGGTLGLRAAGDAPVDELLLAVPGLRRAPPAGGDAVPGPDAWPLIPLDWKRTDGPG